MNADEIPLSELSLKELEKLEGLLGKELKRRREEEREAGLRKLREEARRMGYELEDLIPALTLEKKDKPRRGVLPPVYRSPEDPDVTWSGRGPRPTWFTAHLDAGGSPEDLLIEKGGDS